MSFLQPSIEESLCAAQDPWDWTIDQVVFALTDSESPLLASNRTLSLPDANEFANILRQDETNGLALLCQIGEKSLRKELGIRSRAHRASIIYLIQLLQDQSAKYQRHIVGRGRASSVSASSRMATPSLGSPQNFNPGYHPTFSGFCYSPVGPTGQFQSLPSIDNVFGPPFERRAPSREDILPQAPPLPQPKWHNIQSTDNFTGLGIKSTDTIGGQPEVCGRNGNPNSLGEEALYPNGFAVPPGKNIRVGESTIIDERGTLRRRLVLSSGDIPTPTASHETPSTAVQETPSSPSTLHNDSGEGNRTDAVQESSFTNPASQNGKLVTENHTIDVSVRHETSINNPRDTLAEPGALIIDQDGRKRMRPILLTQSDRLTTPDNPDLTLHENTDHMAPSRAQPISDTNATLSFNQRTFGRRANRNKDQIYLGPEPLSVDELFYGGTALDTALKIDQSLDLSNESDDFSIFLSEKSGNGFSIYVNARMKYFLQSQSMRLSQRGRECIGRIPYPSRIGRKHYPLSITTFSRSSDGITAFRSNRAKWLKDDFARSRGILGKESSNVFNVADPSLAQDNGNDPDWNALEKWKYMGGQDDVLPLYGDSGSEGEYDLDLWKEMQLEQGELARPIGKSKSQKLSVEEVAEAIESATKQIVEEWNLRKKPKLQPKAWRLWVRSRREGNAKAQIDHLTTEINKLEARLADLLTEIAREEWSNLGQIHKQCNILQPSIFDREAQKWKIAVLSLRQKPEKPTHTASGIRKSKTPVLNEALNEGEETLETDAGTSDTSDTSDGNMDDFIIDDDIAMDDYQPAIADDDDTFVADVEDAIDSDTLVGGKDFVLGEEYTSTEMLVPKVESSHKLVAHSSPPKAPIIVDLTLDSDPIEPDTPLTKPEVSFDIKTPPIHSSENESDAFQRSRKKNKVFKKLLIPSPPHVIDLDTDSADLTAIENLPTVKKMRPPLSDVNSIREMDPSELVESQDRERLLIWMIAHAPESRRKGASYYLTRVSSEQSHSEVTRGLERLQEYKRSIRGFDRETSDAILSIASWYVCWNIPVKAEPSGLHTTHIDLALKDITDKDDYDPFYNYLLECLSYYETTSIPLDLSTPKKKRQKIVREDFEGHQSTPIRKRKYIVQESQATLDTRQAAQDRVRGNEERRRREELRSRARAQAKGADLGPSEVIVNPGKLEDQDFIYLNPEFGNGAQMKPHQVEGLQFLWREITAEPEDPQGCLLAQTMGLGKTMQVIALLITLSEAGQSSDKNIRRQVPRPLRKPRTLILCPPALLENWWDEFLIWVPKHSMDNVGGLRKVSVALKPIDRLGEIQAWSDRGGVLLIGYETFKNLVHNSPRTAKKGAVSKALLDDEQHKNVKRSLLDCTNLVIADEAHSFKGKSSKLNSAMNQIKTRSRIALTGSPLSNNLEEYYTIIDWIAPSYLGTYTEFKATYEEPIREGLYQDSTDSQYRESRKRLKALELEMEPKVHRANISVLDNDLKGKMEFVVRVPLTKLQKELYRMCVDSIRSVVTGQEPGKALLWSWLGVLQLLCNHPKCFSDQILAIKANLAEGGASKASVIENPEDQNIIDEGVLGSDEDAIVLAEPQGANAFTRIIEESEKILQAITEPLEALCLSNKMQILMRILKFANAAQDKVLVFSHRIATLDYIEAQLDSEDQGYARIDGTTATQKRQQITKSFNEGKVDICIISTRAGGTGLNLYGANRVVILDDHFNPCWELQAIGRAYRIGQQKPVYVYRLTAGGTFEQEIQNQALFKEQLANRVVDKKNPNRSALKGAGQYLFPLKNPPDEDLTPFHGKDPKVLDRLLADRTENPIISITPTETFHIEDGVELTAAERREAEQMQKDEQLRRRDPKAYYTMDAERRARQTQSVRHPTRLPHSAIETTVNGLSNSQPSRLITFPSSSSHDLGLPPSTAPASKKFMGGLPYTTNPMSNGTDTTTTNQAHASRGLRLSPDVDELETLGKGASSPELGSSDHALPVSLRATRTDFESAPASDSIANRNANPKQTRNEDAEAPRAMLAYEDKMATVVHAVRSETALGTLSSNKRKHTGGDGNDIPRKLIMLPGGDNGVRSTPPNPDFKGQGETEDQLTIFLQREFSRSSK